MKKIKLNDKYFSRTNVMIGDVEEVTYTDENYELVTDQIILQELEVIYENICFIELIPELSII